MKLLYAEDEVAMSEAVCDILRYHKYNVDAVYDGEEALFYARNEQYDGIIRKIAHFASYALLAYLMYHALVLASFFHYINIYVPAAISVVLCAVFAATDEYHQTFVDGRAGRFTDVLIDTSGAL